MPIKSGDFPERCHRFRSVKALVQHALAENRCLQRKADNVTVLVAARCFPSMGLGAMVGKSPIFMGYFYGINGIYIYILWIYGYMDIFIGYHYEINGFILLKKGLGGCFETTLQQKVNFVQAFPIFELALKFLTLVRNMAAKCCFFCATWF